MIKIEQVPEFEKTTTLKLIKNFPYKPYRGYPGAEEKNVCNFVHNDIKRLMSAEGSAGFIAREGEQILAALSFGHQPWDSRLFDTKMGIIKYLLFDPANPQSQDAATRLISEVVRWAKAQKYQFILQKICTDDILSLRALEDNRFKLVDTLLDYVYDPYKKPFTNLQVPVLIAGASLRLATLEDEAALKAIAAQSFTHHFGRYHSDQFIPKARADQVYVEWVSSSLRGYADFIIVMEVEKRIAAYSIWKYTSDEEKKDGLPIGHYSLGAVHPDFFGQGLFYAITYEGMRRMVTNAKCVEGPTHINNYPVQRGYTRLGWQIYNAHHSLHLWL